MNKKRQARTCISSHSHFTRDQKGEKLTVSRTDSATIPSAVKVQLKVNELEREQRRIEGPMHQWLVMTYHVLNENDNAVGDPHATPKLTVSPCRLEVSFGLEKDEWEA